MAVDNYFFQALTGPMQQAGAIQAQREQRKLQEYQLMQQQRQLELQQLDKQKQIQSQVNTATEAARMDLYTKNNFARQKDIDDFRDWHNTMSGWSDIQAVLREHGSVDNARLYGNLDYLLEEYKGKLKTNPISMRTNKNKASLELYHAYALDKDGNGKFLTGRSKERYKEFVNGKIDNFIFNGPRADYLKEATKDRLASDNISLDEVIADNYSAIIMDMVNDQNPADAQAYMQALSDQDIRNWVSKELGHYSSGSISYFGDKALYGEKEIDTEFSTELVRSIDATNKTGVYKGSDFFRFRDQNISFKQLFDETSAMDWDRLGGYDKSSTMKSYKGIKAPFAKGREMVGSGRIFAYNQGLEDQITMAWAGAYNDENKTSRYNSKNRQVNGISMLGLYDSRGHKIQDRDISSMWITGKDSWQESETDDLRLTGYHIALEGKNADGDSFLLTDVSSEEDMNKMREKYKDTTFDYVIVAELIDDDMVTHDDAYYKKVDLGDANVQAAINQNVNSENINRVKGQMASYSQELAHKKHAEKRRVTNSIKLQKQLDLPDDAAVNQVVSAYDQSLTIGLGMANVSATKIQQVMPMIISDLYVNSRQPREYPIVMEEDGQGNPTMVANNASEYMAYSAQKLKAGLVNNDPNFTAMLEAIKTGKYDAYSESIMTPVGYKQSRSISKSITQYSY
tara:strand:- start:8492 stop:10540 length:2049 start_codon:yes stop_codon:yes gene_type:complete